MFVFKLQNFVLQRKLTEFSAILKQQQNDNMSRLVSHQKKRPGTRAITNSGKFQNNCPLFVWQNQDNFVQSVIIHVINDLTIISGYQDKIAGN